MRVPESRRALLIGIEQYALSGQGLNGPRADVEALTELLSVHEDGTPNFECRSLVDRTEDGREINKPVLRQLIRDLFDDYRGDVLFYFSGHGVLTDNGGVLATCDAREDDWGVAMEELANAARTSPARDVLLILDCCSSGDIGNPPILAGGQSSGPLVVLRENMTVIAASGPRGVAVEAGGVGLFTAAVCDALRGGAADHMGFVSASGIYAYVERRFGSWDQRPLFRTNATTVPVVRRCAPLIERLKLVRLVDLFPTVDYLLQLDPEFEPEDEFGNVHEPVNAEKVATATLLKDFRDAGLVKATEVGEQFYWVARRSHSIELTPRGREYWWLVSTGRL